MTEAHDLDGDGRADVLPSGVDSNGDGIDDAFDGITGSDDVSQRWRTVNDPGLCSEQDIGKLLRAVSGAATALEARTPKFQNIAAGCTAVSSDRSMIGKAHTTLDEIRSLVAARFDNPELECPVNVCTISKTADVAKSLKAKAKQLFRFGLSSKVRAITACRVKQDPNAKDGRNTTLDDYRALLKAIAKLPATVTTCPWGRFEYYLSALASLTKRKLGF